MIKPRRIGHATFETADIEKQIAYRITSLGPWHRAARPKTGPKLRSFAVGNYVNFYIAEPNGV
jgi:hypothetical protein